MIQISFVIPTYNFGAFIGETLTSILNEQRVKWEAIVYDGCSADSTPTVMREYCQRDPRIRYIQSKKRENIDVDLNNAVLHASGEYIWTLSADDVLVPGWGTEIQRLLNAHKADICLLPAIHCTIDMKPYRKFEILREPGDADSVWSLRNDEDVTRYIHAARTSEALFSFCSSCLVKRERIIQTDSLLSANGTCWRYAARLISAAVSYPTKIVIARNFLLWKRGDNDSFSGKGIVNRIAISILEWTRAINQLGVSAELKEKMIRLVHSDISLLSMLYAGQLTRNAEERRVYELCVFQRFSEQTLLTRAKRRLLLSQVGSIPGAMPLLRWTRRVVQGLRRRIQELRYKRSNDFVA